MISFDPRLLTTLYTTQPTYPDSRLSEEIEAAAIARAMLQDRPNEPVHFERDGVEVKARRRR